ncbi:MAG TPA: hypothetical protein VGI92_10770 [Gemmatimonadales bacterium]
MKGFLPTMLLALGAAGCAHHAPPVVATRPAARAAAPITPSTSFQTQVQGRLDRLTGNAKEQGYGHLAGEAIFGRIDDRATASHDLLLTAGIEYALMATCDSDCSNVDLKVFDSQGTMILGDTSADNTPVLTFTANTSGRYRADVIMAACNHSPCYYGLQLLTK